MARLIFTLLFLTTFSEVIHILKTVKAIPVEVEKISGSGEQQLVGSGEAGVTEVSSSSGVVVTGSGDVTQGELAPPGDRTGEKGCLDDQGLFRASGSSWHIGCEKFCECAPSAEGYSHTCTPPRCAIPMLTPGCKIVPNPMRNDTRGEHCCDAVECIPMNCRDNSGRDHPLYAAWQDGELDCFCQYNYELDKAETLCSLFPAEVPLPAPMESSENILSSVEREEDSREELPEGLSEVCRDDSGNTYNIGQSWKVGCQQECSCVEKEERVTTECSPFPCPIPQILPGCKIISNPQKDEATSQNCCDAVVCDAKECRGDNGETHAVNTLWYEQDKSCICVHNYNTDQAEKECRIENNPV